MVRVKIEYKPTESLLVEPEITMFWFKRISISCDPGCYSVLDFS